MSMIQYNATSSRIEKDLRPCKWYETELIFAFVRQLAVLMVNIFDTFVIVCHFSFLITFDPCRLFLSQLGVFVFSCMIKSQLEKPSETNK